MIFLWKKRDSSKIFSGSDVLNIREGMHQLSFAHDPQIKTLESAMNQRVSTPKTERQKIPGWVSFFVSPKKLRRAVGREAMFTTIGGVFIALTLNDFLNGEKVIGGLFVISVCLTLSVLQDQAIRWMDRNESWGQQHDND